jgi:hypothetical protein
MHLRPVAALVATALALSSCSMAFVDAPPATRPVTGEVDCTSGQTYPVLDFVGAGALAYVGIGTHSDLVESRPIYKDTTAMLLLAGGAVALASGLVGMKRVGQCRRLKEEVELKRAMRPFEGRTAPTPGRDPWLAAGAPPEGFTTAPAPMVPAPDGGAGAEVGP